MFYCGHGHLSDGEKEKKKHGHLLFIHSFTLSFKSWPLAVLYWQTLVTCGPTHPVYADIRGVVPGETTCTGRLNFACHMPSEEGCNFEMC